MNDGQKMRVNRMRVLVSAMPMKPARRLRIYRDRRNQRPQGYRRRHQMVLGTLEAKEPEAVGGAVSCCATNQPVPKGEAAHLRW